MKPELQNTVARRCLYIKKREDVDIKVLEKMITAAAK
ncbi:MAG: hypothetical protein JWQ09_1833 [Segetibacter sp.]|nr:hypothetical protein [Segetibacter sp.]